MNIKTMSKRSASVKKWLTRRNCSPTKCFFSVLGECHATFLTAEKTFDRVARGLIGAMRLNSDLMERLMKTGMTALAMVIFVLNMAVTCVSAAEKLVAGYSSISPAEWTLVSAAKTNLFEKYDLDVSTVYLGGSTRIVQVMIAGDIQIGQIGGSAALFGKAAGVDMAFIATTINSMAG